MNPVVPLTRAFERLPIPNAVSRLAIASLVARSDRSLSRAAAADDDATFAALMRDHPIAEHTRAANAQHYELPPEFFAAFLGHRRKYSSCLYDLDDQSDTIDAAEDRALDETIVHANLFDGQSILELGCGWGSLTLAMAERFPNARIVAVSNSAAQRRTIETLAARRGLHGVEVVTADMNDFRPAGTFDRIVSVEMFEHMANWQTLLGRVREWLAPDGRLFLHVFSHRSTAYRFRKDDPADWIAQHFFTGGIMPSHNLIRQFAGSFAIEREWRWDGRHYRRTAEDWLARFDAASDRIDPLLAATYAGDASLWRRRWRLFFLATAGLFGHREGSSWGVSHYRLAPVAP